MLRELHTLSNAAHEAADNIFYSLDAYAEDGSTGLHSNLETAGETPEDLAVASTPTHASTVGCDAAYLIKDFS